MYDVESSLVEDGAASSDKSTKQAMKSPSESPASSKAGTSQQGVIMHKMVKITK